MDSIANQSANERRTYFEQAAIQHGRLSAQLMEKDFWVCWTLRRLFMLPELADHLTFKGGTSLSKVHGVIERFSEDVDVTVEREYLGFGGADDPELAGSNQKVERQIAQLVKACESFVADELQPALENAIAQSLGHADWTLTLDREEPSLRFQFPAAITTGLSQYFAPSIKIELGARADPYPVEDGTVQPYLHDTFPDLMSDSSVDVRVLDLARTFWEKATILHSIHHQPAIKPLGPRQSRHYYDLFQLADHAIKSEALERLDLLDRVATHKRIYFRAAWAKYREACPGSLRLVPGAERIRELTSDYEDMQPMFFGDYPTFEHILSRLQSLENAINET